MQPLNIHWVSVLGLACLMGCDPGPPASVASQPATTLVSGTLPADQTFLDVVAQPLPAGIRVRVISHDAPLLLVEIDAQHVTPHVIAAPETGISPLDALRQNNIDVIIGSGFVTDVESLTPVGLLQHNGEVLSPVQEHGYTRVLGVAENQLRVLHRNDFDAANFTGALQVGPGIIEQARLDISERDLQRTAYFRSFIALCGERWIAGISLTPSHLRTLGEALIEDAQTTGEQCTEVVNLAGDRQSVLLIRTASGDIFHHGDTNARKVSLIGFSAP